MALALGSVCDDEVRSAGQNFSFIGFMTRGGVARKSGRGCREGTSTGDRARYKDESHGTYLSIVI